MHRAALAHAGLPGDYQARDVDAAGFAIPVDELRRGVLDGANVTMPHKQLACRTSDRQTDRATRIGAVNTLVMRDGELVGDSTDVDGIRMAWETRALPVDAPVVILGAGGAAGAALLATEGMPQYVMARRPQQAAALVKHVGVDAVVVAWEDAAPSGVVVNATSIGMGGEVLPEQVLDGACGLLDMAYGFVATPAVAALRDARIPVADGLDMLVGQAASSFAIWTGIDLDPDIFRRAGEHELLKRSQSRTRVEE
jgi:shikimate dehydrogenase